MTRFLQCIVAVLVTIIPGRAAAQDSLTLAQAVHEAVTQNASIRAIRAASAEAAAHVTEAHAGWLPRVSVTESWQRGDQPVFVFGSLLSARQFSSANFAVDSLNHPDPIGFFRTSFGVEQLLFDSGRQRSAVDRAALRQENSGFLVDETSAGVALAATQAFGRILAAESGHRAAVVAVDAAREDLARAQRRRDAGMATDADVLALAAHVADLQQRVIESDGEAAVSRAELNRLMGAPITRNYVVGESADVELLVETGVNLDALFKEAEANRPELRRALVAERLADAERGNARAGLLPQIALQAGMDISGLQFADRTSAWLIGGEVRWNLSLGGAELARIKASTEARARAAAEAEDARAAVQVEVVTAVRRLESARARLTAGRAAVDEARETQRIIRDRFDAGVAGVTDVLRASSAVLNAETQRVSASVDRLVSVAALQRALGRHP